MNYYKRYHAKVLSRVLAKPTSFIFIFLRPSSVQNLFFPLYVWPNYCRWEPITNISKNYSLHKVFNFSYFIFILINLLNLFKMVADYDFWTNNRSLCSFLHKQQSEKSKNILLTVWTNYLTFVFQPCVFYM